MKSILVLCALVGLSSAVPAFTKIDMNALCESISEYFNVLAKHTDVDAHVYAEDGASGLDMTVHFKPGSLNMGNCILVNTSSSVGLELNLADSLVLTANGVEYNVSTCAIQIQYIIYNDNSTTYMDVSVAQIVSLGAVTNGNKDYTAYAQTILMPHLNDALYHYTKDNLSFKVSQSSDDSSNAEEAIRTLLKGTLTKIAKVYL